jgi:steroid 5-alpha reductase family enzyme
MSVLIAMVVLAIFCAGAMALAWRVVLTSGRSGWADTFWSFTVGIAGIVAALWPIGELTGRNWLVALLVAVWSGRLGLHIARRTLKGGDDPRYAELKRGWGDRYKPQLLLFLEIQAGVALLLAIAVMAAANNPAPLGLGDALGVLIAIAAIGGESLADAQLSRFARNPANRGKVCDRGLWAWSRHPNYFFEFLYWVALVPIGIGIGYGWGWVALAAPVMMFVLLRHVSGVPPLEQHMLRSRGTAFTAYQQRVPAFFPRPPRQ